ncbi:two pore domain potassium channel family protein [Methanolobus zinderi]|uniref:Two pore domain potassium channel family protein n=1 Tax=Methanolobus zinderi TaxID=536044 RepID=A0A7D5IRM4_9EURY|nr:two pore domain potassium channel family protein [Methanolobus zinderi]
MEGNSACEFQKNISISFNSTVTDSTIRYPYVFCRRSSRWFYHNSFKHLLASTTLLSIGFGDIVPQTGLGRFVAFILQLLGYTILIAPIVIVIAETFISLCDSLSKKNEDFE